jgi:hypothetical protein
MRLLGCSTKNVNHRIFCFTVVPPKPVVHAWFWRGAAPISVERSTMDPKPREAAYPGRSPAFRYGVERSTEIVDSLVQIHGFGGRFGAANQAKHLFTLPIPIQSTYFHVIYYLYECV